MKHTKKETFETFCPLFPGFYGTVFEYDREDDDINWYNDENKTELGYDDFEWNYKDYNQRVCEAFVNRLESELMDFLPIEFEFQEIISPREYNFTTDSINIVAKLDLRQLQGLIRDRREDAAKYFKDKYTSRSGFISFHSPYIEDWLNEAYIRENTGHRIGALLDCLCSIEIEQDLTWEWVSSECYIDFSPKNKVKA